MGEMICPGLPGGWINAWLAAVGATVLDDRLTLRWTTDGAHPWQCSQPRRSTPLPFWSSRGRPGNSCATSRLPRTGGEQQLYGGRSKLRRFDNGFEPPAATGTRGLCPQR